MPACCPHCDSTHPVELDGVHTCARCGRPFEVYRPVVELKGATGVAEEPAAGTARCARHPANAAVANCDRCGDFICAVCLTAIERRRLCPGCFDIEHARGGLETTRRPSGSGKAALGCGIAALALSPWLILWSVSGLLGLLAVILGAYGMAESARGQEKRSGQSLAGIILGVLAIIVTVSAFVVVPFILTRAGVRLD